MARDQARVSAATVYESIGVDQARVSASVTLAGYRRTCLVCVCERERDRERQGDRESGTSRMSAVPANDKQQTVVQRAAAGTRAAGGHILFYSLLCRIRVRKQQEQGAALPCR